ncbi:hypothetical protein UA08_00752 [Talaromyces atroroseus]|uniref:Developmental and secondary metabolism regulator veA n=1 Tax=Talaromyces atroroseus TaxID=1441469 RepID=A0A225B6P2_TALAT|nr:hypothetical protein UA08_00752 [Talaromyces atroroseus]OKL63799.1 hypothetical protein UA08_00752 [Talaromyces atroroseus]
MSSNNVALNNKIKMTAASRPGLLTPVNETEHSFSRISREGKRITYNLKVIQQPERARACGAGAKSSADRRPVDPPPVVELRVYESDVDNDMSKTDITFAYNANFFLFATLENARPIAQGRVSGQAPNCPVLTGVPVAGIAYLDRPAQAGYFIFPDLSVRHEGFYRLNFNLYEEVKDAKDADKDTPLPSPQSQASSGKPTAPKSFLNFRLEVKSAPFQVYSAKKFPGLATSTSLSRVVAEQGCRVRIRRDVRMRRRGEKSSKDYGEYDEDRYGRSSSRYATPTPVERPRSASTASAVEPPYAYPQTPRRDSSSHEYSAYHTHHPVPPPPPVAPSPYQHSHPAPPPPPPSTLSSGAPGYLTFGSTPTSYQAPPLPAAPPPPPHRAYTPGSSTPKSYSSHASLPHSRHPSSSSEHESVQISYPTRSHNLPSILNPAPVEPAVGTPSSENYHSAASTPTSQTAPQRSRTPSSSIMLPPISSFASSVPPPPPHSSSQHPSDNLHQRRPSYYPIETSLAKRSHEDSFGSYDAIAHHKSVRSAENDYAGVNINNHSSGPTPTGPMTKRGALEVEEPQWDRPQMEYRRADGRMSSKLQLAV